MDDLIERFLPMIKQWAKEDAAQAARDAELCWDMTLYTGFDCSNAILKAAEEL